MKIKKREIQSALEIVRPGLANKEIIEQSTSFAFLGDRVVTYNDEISISHPIDGLELEGAVEAEELYNFIRLSKADTLLIKQTEKELLFKAGKAKAGLTFHSKVVLPLDEVGGDKEWFDLPEDFTHNLVFVKASCSSDMTRPVLTNVHVTKHFMEATDGFQIMKLTHEDWPLENLLIPASAIADIHKIEPTQVALSDGWIHFRNLANTEVSARIMDDKFVDTAIHFEVEGSKAVFPQEMDEILERAQVFTRSEHFMDEEMEIHIKGKALKVTGKNEKGWFEEKAKVSFEGDEKKFWINPQLLITILQRSNKCLIGDEKIKFSGDDWEFIAAMKNPKN